MDERDMAIHLQGQLWAAKDILKSILVDTCYGDFNKSRRQEVAELIKGINNVLSEIGAQYIV